MIRDNKIRNEKVKYDISRKEAKVLALSSSKFDKYEYVTEEEILPSDQSRIIEQAKFAYVPLSKVFEIQIKIIEDQGRKRIEALKVLKPEENTKAD